MSSFLINWLSWVNLGKKILVTKDFQISSKKICLLSWDFQSIYLTTPITTSTYLLVILHLIYLTPEKASKKSKNTNTLKKILLYCRCLISSTPAFTFIIPICRDTWPLAASTDTTFAVLERRGRKTNSPTFGSQAVAFWSFNAAESYDNVDA